MRRRRRPRKCRSTRRRSGCCSTKTRWRPRSWPKASACSPRTCARCANSFPSAWKNPSPPTRPARCRSGAQGFTGQTNMAGPIALDHFKEALVFLGTAAIVVPLFRRLRISPVIGFLGAGVLLGPAMLGRYSDLSPIIQALTFSEVEEMHIFGEFGVVFLLFMIGLELSFERISRLRKLVFGLGALQVAVCAAALGGLAMLFGQSGPAASVIGGALALSSTAIVIP